LKKPAFYGYLYGVRVLCVSDHVDPLVYSPAIKERFKDVSLVISCGDLPFNYYDYILSNLNKPLLFVFGNHNLRRLSDYDCRHRPEPEAEPTGYRPKPPGGGMYISGRVRRIHGVIFAGLGGSMKYNNGLNQFSNRGMYLYLLRLLPGLLWNRLAHGRFLDVLITHAPPEGIHDCRDRCHRGFRAFIWFMRTFKPAYLIHGHVHLYGANELRRTEYQDTVVVNAFDHCVIDVEEWNGKVHRKTAPQPGRA
jgi:hypothetical protein